MTLFQLSEVDPFHERLVAVRDDIGCRWQIGTRASGVLSRTTRDPGNGADQGDESGEVVHVLFPVVLSELGIGGNAICMTPVAENGWSIPG